MRISAALDFCGLLVLEQILLYFLKSFILLLLQKNIFLLKRKKLQMFESLELSIVPTDTPTNILGLNELHLNECNFLIIIFVF